MGDYKTPPFRECVCASVIPFVTFYKNLYFSASIKGIFTNFAHNVYIQENMPSTNFGLILKNKMAATVISLLKNVFFHTVLPGAIFKLGFSNLQGIFTVGRPCLKIILGSFCQTRWPSQPLFY